jgi:hypothetical protein
VAPGEIDEIGLIVCLVHNHLTPTECVSFLAYQSVLTMLHGNFQSLQFELSLEDFEIELELCSRIDSRLTGKIGAARQKRRTLPVWMWRPDQIEHTHEIRWQRRLWINTCQQVQRFGTSLAGAGFPTR